MFNSFYGQIQKAFQGWVDRSFRNPAVSDPVRDYLLQDKAVRQTICNVMEGREKAFEQRYRRIALEGLHVR